MTRDLFGNDYTKLVGPKVQLDRPIDRERPCCNNICIIRPGKEPHADELRCAGCSRHRGWLSKPTARWIEHVVTRFGAPTTPIIVRQSTLEQEEVPEPNPNSRNPNLNSTGNSTMKASDAFRSKFLKTGDVREQPIIAVMSHVAIEPVGQGEDQENKPVLYLKDQKPVVLNRTNFETIEAVFGDSDLWRGRKIKVYCAPTRFAGKPVDGLRVEPIVPKPTPINEEAPF